MMENPQSKKEDNKIKAQKQVQLMDELYSDEIAAATANTTIYTGPLGSWDWNYHAKIQYYRKNPSNFLEEIYNIKLLPYQKYWLNKI